MTFKLLILFCYRQGYVKYNILKLQFEPHLRTDNQTVLSGYAGGYSSYP